MPRKRSSARSGLFSLSARMARRRPARDAWSTGEEFDVHADDGCPICAAMKAGNSVDMVDFLPGEDGSPPRFPEEILLAAAGKALAARQVAPDETVSFMEFGKAVGDGRFAQYSFSVDGEGRIFWIGPTKRELVARLPASG
jgi:hypothetical protein